MAMDAPIMALKIIQSEQFVGFQPRPEDRPFVDLMTDEIVTEIADNALLIFNGVQAGGSNVDGILIGLDAFRMAGTVILKLATFGLNAMNPGQLLGLRAFCNGIVDHLLTSAVAQAQGVTPGPTVKQGTISGLDGERLANAIIQRFTAAGNVIPNSQHFDGIRGLCLGIVEEIEANGLGEVSLQSGGSNQTGIIF